MTPRRARRYVCVFVMLLTLLAITYGCASVDVAERDCDMAHVDWSPVATEGEITLAWRVDPIQVQRNCPGRNYGCARVRGSRADIWLTDEKHSECAVMKLAHELRHGMGATHASIP